MLRSRLTLGVVIFAIALVSVCLSEFDSVERHPIAQRISSNGQQERVTESKLRRLSRDMFYLLSHTGWLSGNKLISPDDERYQTELVTESGLAEPFTKTNEPNYCNWDDWSSNGSHTKMIALLGHHGFTGPDIQLTFRELAQVFPKSQGKPDVLAPPWGPWILQLD